MKMNYFVTLLSIWGVLTGFYSCSNETIPTNETEPIPIEIDFEMEGFDYVTRAGHESGVEVSDIRNFFLLIENPADPEFSYMLEMSNAYGDWRAYDLGTTNQRSLFFKNATDPVRIKAVHWNKDHYHSFFTTKPDRWTRPYNILLDNAVSFSSAYIHSNDPVYANTTLIPKESCPNGKLRLSFRHLFAKVKFFIQLPDGSVTYRRYGASETSPLSDLRIEGLYGAGYNGRYPNWVAATDHIEMPEGMMAEPITLSRYRWTPFNVLTTCYVLMVVPQSVADGTFRVSFQYEGETYHWTCQESDFRFETNKEYEINLKMTTTTRSAAASLTGTIEEGGNQ